MANPHPTANAHPSEELQRLIWQRAGQPTKPDDQDKEGVYWWWLMKFALELVDELDSFVIIAAERAGVTEWCRCGNPIPPRDGSGRPRLHCSNACKQAAHAGR